MENTNKFKNKIKQTYSVPGYKHEIAKPCLHGVVKVLVVITLVLVLRTEINYVQNRLLLVVRRLLR